MFKRLCHTLIFPFLILMIYSCESQSDPPVAPVRFTNIVFDETHAYFSTNGTMTQPVDSLTAKTMVEDIDITFIYPLIAHGDVGFFDPVARSQSWSSMNDFYQPWLHNGMEVRYYRRVFGEYLSFTNAFKDESLIGHYFENGALELIPHPIYSNGSCVGGIGLPADSIYQSITIYDGDVYGFKHTLTGKRGLICVRDILETSGTPDPDTTYMAKVDIIIEH